MMCFTSCRKEPTGFVHQDGVLNLPNTPYKYFDVGPVDGDALATLGRVLFYDKHLSKNNTISCASCHIQEHAFGDNKALSHGFQNKKTSRNSLAIHNINGGSMFITPFPQPVTQLFWDGRSSDLNEMVLLPALNHIEMGMASTGEILNKIKNLDYYKPLFKDIAVTVPTLDDISSALAHFVVSINAKDTKFDRVKDINGHEQFTALEEYGESLFNGKYNCNSCHSNPVSSYGSNGSFINIGLDKQSRDEGLMGVTGNTSDRGKFKAPGLRNIQFSAPYMHDGRFKSLDEVLNHYSHGIQPATNLDRRLMENGQPRKMNISTYDKKALIAFLHTLTDYDVLTHDRFSNPFANQ